MPYRTHVHYYVYNEHTDMRLSIYIHRRVHRYKPPGEIELLVGRLIMAFEKFSKHFVTIVMTV